MKIIHVITGMQKAAGTTTFVENVVSGLSAAGHDVEIVMSAAKFTQCDIMHIHGLWGSLLHKARRYAANNKIPIVWSTHGMTAPWAMRHKLWKKLTAWYLYQRRDLKSAAAIHCTTELEVEWNKSLGFKHCFIAPLGTQLPPIVGVSSSSSRKNEKVLLFVGRIYPVKGLVNLIKAWSLCNVKGWRLRIVGPDQAGHLASLQSLVSQLSLTSSVEFVGPKYGDELSAEYHNCDCLVLPSFTENFGATIVDALACGKPCIASTFTPWKELKDYGCGWWVSNEPEPLSAAIQGMASLADMTRHEMGVNGRGLVEAKYTWDAVVKKMFEGYKEVLHARA